MTPRRAASLIVGGGPAGSAAAIRLGQAGVQAELLERSAAPRDVVCGGFLGWDALAALRRLGVAPEVLGARPIHRLRLVAGRRAVEAALPRPAAGLSRRTLDEALLAHAASSGALVRRGVAVRSASLDSVRTEDEEIVSDVLFLATGKHELRGLAREVPGERGAGAVGLRASYVPDPGTMRDLSGIIELHPFNGGYAGVLLQEDGRVNLCLSVAADRLKAASGIAPLLGRIAAEAPRLGDRLAAAKGEEWLTISNVPYGWRHLSGRAGLFRLGDQAAVIASLAGDGIAIALTSGIAAADSLLSGEGAAAYQPAFARRAARPLAVAEALRWAAERPLPRHVMTSLAALVPGAAGWAARLTRVGETGPAGQRPVSAAGASSRH